MKALLLKLIKSPLFWLIAAVIVLGSVCSVQSARLKEVKAEASRLEDNQSALLGQIECYKTENGELAASVQAVTLKADELSSLIPAYESELKQLRIGLKNAKSLAHLSTQTTAEIAAPLIVRELKEDDAPASSGQVQSAPRDSRDFSWSDEWISVSGKVYRDTVICSFVSRDSLTLVAHYAKRKCIFARWRKGKLVKYDVVSANPHTEIADVEYIEVVE